MFAREVDGLPLLRPWGRVARVAWPLDHETCLYGVLGVRARRLQLEVALVSDSYNTCNELVGTPCDGMGWGGMEMDGLRGSSGIGWEGVGLGQDGLTIQDVM